jgi:hypothetical protein
MCWMSMISAPATTAVGSASIAGLILRALSYPTSRT